MLGTSSTALLAHGIRHPETEIHRSGGDLRMTVIASTSASFAVQASARHQNEPAEVRREDRQQAGNRTAGRTGPRSTREARGGKVRMSVQVYLTKS
jgi:hypothetical protein